jgi:hypothetical protein
MKLTRAQKIQADNYQYATANALGNLHERMRCVRTLAQKEHENLSPALYSAIFDLETEVSCHRPMDPPCGKREV